MKIFKSICIILGIGAMVLFAYAFIDRQFKLSNVKGDWPQAENEPITNHQLLFLEEVFSQPFQYLDRGKQSYVFISRDQKYVLKLFDNRCLRSGFFPFLFSIKREKCMKRLARLFTGYQIASTSLADHSGLLFLQLVPDGTYHLEVSITDRFGLKHKINLAEIPFAVQKKAIPLRELITTLLNEGKVAEAEKRLYQILDMYVEGYKKGVLDLDRNFMYNTGFAGDQPLRIDLGRIVLDEEIKEPQNYRQDLQRVFNKRLGEWLERHFPKYRQQILQDMEEKLNRVFQ